jgi:hypothetical protein
MISISHTSIQKCIFGFFIIGVSVELNNVINVYRTKNKKYISSMINTVIFRGVVYSNIGIGVILICKSFEDYMVYILNNRIKPYHSYNIFSNFFKYND